MELHIAQTPKKIFKYGYILNEQNLVQAVQKAEITHSLDQLASKLDIKLTNLPEIASGRIGRKMTVEKSGVTIWDGIVWDDSDGNYDSSSFEMTVYSPLIYLKESEDEFLFSEHTASARIKIICQKWGIPIDYLPDTKINLEEKLIRSRPLGTMIYDFLKETAEKGGNLYALRMTNQGLSLFEIGSNSDVYVIRAWERKNHKLSMSGVVTKVKVLGEAVDNQLSPVLATAERDIAKFGTIQKIAYKAKEDKTSAETIANNKLAGLSDSYVLDIPESADIQVGDKVILQGMELICTSIRHILGNFGRTYLELSPFENVRQEYFKR